MLIMVIHQTICTHTSQQNGVIEQKHHHSLDVACTLLFHMQVPKYSYANATYVYEFKATLQRSRLYKQCSKEITQAQSKLLLEHETYIIARKLKNIQD